MTYGRDPLSVQFDPQAKLTIRLAIEQAEKAAANRRLVPYIRVRVPNPPGTMPVRETRGSELSPHERAFTRACYYDGRIHNANPKFHPDSRWPLKLTWNAVPVLPGAARVVTVQVFPDTAGARFAADKMPAEAKFVEAGPNRGGVGLLG